MITDAIDLTYRYIFHSAEDHPVPMKDGAECTILYAMHNGRWNWMVQFDDDTRLPARSTELTKKIASP